MRKTVSRFMDGFTIVELVTVIVVLAIVVAISSFGFAAVQRNARDETRKADAIAIAEALEKFYDANGEYPSCSRLTSNPSLLNISADMLKTPSADSSSTHSLVCTSLADSQDSYAYIGEQTTACQTGAVCREWQLEYRKESTGEIVAIQSRRNRSNVALTPLQAPGTPTITAAMSGTTARATLTAVTCASGTTPEYQFRSRNTSTTTDGAWSSYGTWGTATVYNIASSQGRKYDFQAQARCVNDETTSNSVASAVAAVIAPITLPSAPIITLTAPGTGSTSTHGTTLTGLSDSVTFTYATTCPSGTTTSYSTAYYRNDASGWRSWAANTSATSYGLATNYQGYTYAGKVRAQCSTGQYTSAYSAESATLLFARTLQTPALTLNSTGYTSTQHSWTARLGSTQYAVQYGRDSSASTWGTSVASNSTAIGALTPGYQYYYRVRAENSVTGVVSAWSNVTTSENLWLKSGNLLGSQWSFEGCGSYPTSCSQWTDGDQAYPASRMAYLEGRSRHGSALLDNVRATTGGGSTARTIAYNAYGKTLTASLWVWSSTGSPTVTLALRSLNAPPGGPNELAVGTTVATQGQWSLVWLTANFTNASYTLYSKFEIYIPANTHLWIDGAQLFEGTWGS